MNVACTIIDADFLHYALALNESLLNFNDTTLYMLIMGDRINAAEITEKYPNVRILYLEDISNNQLIIEIIVKYINTDINALRWGLKPFLVHYLLEFNENVFWLDSDLFFFNDYKFLFEELKENDIILIPHWRNINPNHENKLERTNYKLLFTDGLFNAGFVGANRRAKQAIWWWATACTADCELNADKGLFADQAYLSVLPVYFNNVKIIQHKGCDVSSWNMVLCERIRAENGETLINNQYPIIFIHFTAHTIECAKNGIDPLLLKHTEKYLQTLEKYKPLSQPYKERKIKMLEKKQQIQKSKLLKLKEFLRPMTRIKRFLAG
jgi:hypothetical protein